MHFNKFYFIRGTNGIEIAPQENWDIYDNLIINDYRDRDSLIISDRSGLVLERKISLISVICKMVIHI